MKGKNLLVILLITSLVLLGVLSGCSDTTNESSEESSNTDEVYTMKLANITTEDNPLNVGYRYLAEQLKEKSNERIILNIYPNGQMSGSDREQAEMVQNNIIQITSSPSYTVAGLNDELKEFNIYDFPYLFKSDKEIHNFSDGDIGSKMNEELLNKTGVRAYGAFPIGWVKVSTNEEPIESPENLEGLNIRSTASVFYQETLRAWGANPTPIAYGEAFTALQQGTVDGMMTVSSLYVSDRFYEVQKYMAAVDPFGIIHYPIVNNEWYQSLPKDLQNIFDECMYDYVSFMRELETEAEAESLDILREKGMVVNEYNDEQMKAFVEPVTSIWQENAHLVGGEDFLNSVIDDLE